MIRFFLRSKIHRATVTEANVAYEGQILTHCPKLVFVDEANRVREIREAETAKTSTV